MLRYRIDLSYRRPLAVIRFIRHGGSAYPICPKCQVPLDREYMAYCDRCGQCLRWDRYRPLPCTPSFRQGRGGR